MAANNVLQLSGINFDDIKENLKTFLSSQKELEDYNYESSTMSVLLNLLAYNTYQNNFYLNMVANEMFLDSAQIRANIVSRAKMLGYTPLSSKGATATIQVTITPDDSPTTITINENTQFRSQIDGKNYIFVNPEAKVINADSSGVFSTNLTVKEGLPLTHKFNVDSDTEKRFIIPNDEVDTGSLKVTVQESAANSNVVLYSNAVDLTQVGGDTAAYFLNENEEGRYELLFGDGVLGKKLFNGNVINVSYRVVNGPKADSAATFTNVTTVGGYSTVTVAVNTVAEGGADRESIQSIKFNAPKNYEAQNRAVTIKDYEALVKNQFPDLQTVSVWGGEDNTPPVYGKAYISVKPRAGNLISQDRKNDIKSFLQNKNVLSIEPEVVDPTFLYVAPAFTIKYNPDLTSLSAGALNDKIITTIKSYENIKLGLFGKPFIGSEMTSDIITTDDSIISVQTTLQMKKQFIPSATLTSTYKIPFSNSLHHPHAGHQYAISSTKFTFNGNSNAYLDDDGNGTLRVYTLVGTTTRSYLDNNVGSVDYATGLVTLEAILIPAFEGDFITISAKPNLDDIDPLRNQILLIKDSTVSLFDTQIKNTVISTTNISTEGNSTSIPDSGVVATVY